MLLDSPMMEDIHCEASSLNGSFMDPLLDTFSNAPFNHELNFNFYDQNYRYQDVNTPCSSLSPASSCPVQSPTNYSILTTDVSVNSPSPPPTTKQLTEFLNASSNSTQIHPFEYDFSKLTLTGRFSSK